MGCCASLTGVEAPEITPEQIAHIADLVFTQVGGYAPKFTVAFCAILCEESKKQRKGGPQIVLEFKAAEVEKHAIHAMKMADDPEFDPTTVTAKKDEEEDKAPENEAKEQVEAAVDAALEAFDDDDGDDDGSGGDSKVNSESVRDAVVEQLGDLKADLQSKMAGVPEQISGKVIDAALKKAVIKALEKILWQFATLQVAEWNKLVKAKKDPKRIFKRAQKVCKAIKDINSLKENVMKFAEAVESGDALAAAEAAKGAVEDAQAVKEDAENLEKMQKGKDHSHSDHD